METKALAILDMMNRIVALESKVKELEEKLEVVTAQPQLQTNVQLDKVSAKYRGLAEYLLASNEARITLSYPQIEAILGFSLPDSAKNFKQSFWANTMTHSYASSWLSVGYKTRVDVEHETVTFVKNLF